MNLGQFFFKYRGFTPIPMVLIVLIFAQPTPVSFLWGILLMLAGESIRLWGVAYAGGATRTRNVGANQLVTNGPFGRVRNPLYLGNILMYCGAAVVANTWLPYLVIFVLIFFGVQYYFIIRLEEEKLSELFGTEYAEYCQAVPRIIPRIKNISSARPVKPDAGGAFRSEKSSFLSFATVLLFMVLKMYFF